MEEKRKLILWIHGFAGKPDNDSVQEMRRRYPAYDFYSIEVDHRAVASMEKINAFIQSHEVALVAGTSCGGFYAMCARFDGPRLVVNPVVDPVRDLRQFLGANTYKPGRPDGQTTFLFTEEMRRSMPPLRCSLSLPHPLPPHGARPRTGRGHQGGLCPNVLPAAGNSGEHPPQPLPHLPLCEDGVWTDCEGDTWV